MIDVAERNIKNHDVVPLLYDMGKAGSQPVTNEEFYNGLKRAHDYSGIGQVSNSLTKLWNRDNPDYVAAGLLCFYNNLVIDAAKTGFIDSYENYPDVKKRINKAIGGKTGKMPYFFQFSKNGRRQSKLTAKEQKSVAKPTNSTMNRICALFDDVGHINMNYANVPPFNWQMLLDKADYSYYPEAIELFCGLDDGNLAAAIQPDIDNQNLLNSYEFIAQDIIKILTEKYGSLEAVYPTIVKYLFAGDNMNKVAHKRMFWRVFGNIAADIIESNLETYTTCPTCGMKIPKWADNHLCPKNHKGFYECVDCGAWCERTNSKQCRCADCQEEAVRVRNNLLNKMKYQLKKKG